MTAVTLVQSGSPPDASYVVVAADRPDAHGFGISPELVLVDAALAAEVRHLLVIPETPLNDFNAAVTAAHVGCKKLLRIPSQTTTAWRNMSALSFPRTTSHRRKAGGT